MKKLFSTICLALGLAGTALAASGVGYPHDHFDANLKDEVSLQRGARLFVNYCAGCHSLKYQRYNRLFKDLKIDPEVGAENLIFTGANPPDPMHRAMTAEQGAKWFGVAPPDLSLTARSRGGEWIYNYLRAFYVDAKHSLGMNNGVFPGASMPHALVELQGIQQPIYSEHAHCSKVEGKQVCETTQVLSGFELVKAGSLSPAQYDQAVYDLSNFLTYVGDPSALQRMRLGPWVLLFILFITSIFYLLKREYWRGIH